MAKPGGADMPNCPEQSLLSLLRESGDALEAVSPPFDAAAAAARLREAARAHGLLRPADIPEDGLWATDAELEQEAPPFDVEAGAARLREAAGERGLLPGDASEDSVEEAARRFRAGEAHPLAGGFTDETATGHGLRAVPPTSTPDTGASAEDDGLQSSWRTLVEGDEASGYRGPFACAAAGITYNQLDYWARTGLVEPSVRAAHGSGSQRLYGFRDILVLKVVKRLLDTGISLQQIRAAVQHLRDRSSEDLARVTLMSDGVSVYECTSPDEVVNLLQGGTGVFGIALGRVWHEVAGELEELHEVHAKGRLMASSSDHPENIGKASGAIA
jgi:DNA-binding transcriptional MerR regulator